MIRCPKCNHRFSSWARPKKKHAYTKGEHEYLVGILAKTQRRIEIFRNAGGEVEWFDVHDPSTVEEIRPATCQGCTEPHLIGWTEGHWHHNCEMKKKCDAAKCSLFVCEIWHTRFHGRIIQTVQREKVSPAVKL